MKYQKHAVIFISLVILFAVIPLFDAKLLAWMIPGYLAVTLLMLVSPVGDYAELLLIVTSGAVIYVLFCGECSALSKSSIFTLWLSYLSAFTVNRKREDNSSQ